MGIPQQFDYVQQCLELTIPCQAMTPSNIVSLSNHYRSNTGASQMFVVRPFAILLLGVIACFGGDTTASAWQVDSPLYKSWAQFPVGTKIKIESVTMVDDNEESRVETTTTAELVSLTPDKAIVLKTEAVRSAGTEEAVASRRSTIRRKFYPPPSVRPEDVGKPPRSAEQGEEEIEMLGKTYQAVWYVTEGVTENGKSFAKTWISEEVPGKLLKSVIRVPASGKTTTKTLVELTTP